MSLFHVSLVLGRSDSNYYESGSLDNILNFFSLVSLSVVRSVKKVLFSKDYKINYVDKTYVPEPTYTKVVVVASSKSYTKTFTFRDVKQSVTEEKIKETLKGMLIRNEPIVDFFDIQFYNDEGVSPTKNITNLFQVQYRRRTGTYTEELFVKDWQTAKQIIEDLIDGEVTEVRQYLYYDPKNKKDYGLQYHKRVSLSVQNELRTKTITLPKVDIKIDHQTLINNVSSAFLVHGKPIDKDKTTVTYR